MSPPTDACKNHHVLEILILKCARGYMFLIFDPEKRELDPRLKTYTPTELDEEVVSK